jgi:hypothetical protein
MAFLQRVVNGDGTLEREYAIGRGRMDLCLRYGDLTLGMELKVWRDGAPTRCRGPGPARRLPGRPRPRHRLAGHLRPPVPAAALITVPTVLSFKETGSGSLPGSPSARWPDTAFLSAVPCRLRFGLREFWSMLKPTHGFNEPADSHSLQKTPAKPPPLTFVQSPL